MLKYALDKEVKQYLKKLKKRGWVNEEHLPNNHVRLTWPHGPDGDNTITVGSTPSDFRWKLPSFAKVKRIEKAYPAPVVEPKVKPQRVEPEIKTTPTQVITQPAIEETPEVQAPKTRGRKKMTPEEIEAARPDHGTVQGYKFHTNHKEKPCEECIEAINRHNKNEGKCGTPLGYRRHQHQGEHPCRKCMKAQENFQSFVDDYEKDGDKISTGERAKLLRSKFASNEDKDPKGDRYDDKKYDYSRQEKRQTPKGKGVYREWWEDLEDEDE